MSFVSLSFILLFVVFAVLYFAFPHKFQWPMLLIFSYSFYWLAAQKLPIYMITTTIVTFITAFMIDKTSNKYDDYIKKNKETITKQDKKELKNKPKTKKDFFLLLH